MVINVHAGHNPDGKVACGAVGLIKESTEARRIKDAVIKKMREAGHIVYDCTCDNGTSQSNVLTKIVKKCNSHKADLDMSIHFNAGANKGKDGKTTGTEVLIYSSPSKAKSYASAVASAIASTGLKSRGVKYGPGLYFLKFAKAPAMLIEVCFVDDPEDVALYQRSFDKIVSAIVSTVPGTTSKYDAVFNASYYSNRYPDLKVAFGTDKTKLLNHFVTNGMSEGRQGCANFNVQIYKERYNDLQKAFGEDLPKFYMHYIEHGKAEGRTGI